MHLLSPARVLVAVLSLHPVAIVAQSAPATGTVRLEVGATGNEARYRVREQLAGLDFPNDAVGATSAIAGGITLDDGGRVVADRSVITVDLRGLTSDKERRDGYLQRRTLQTGEHPTAVLRVTGFDGLVTPLPTSGTLTFRLTGDLTIRGTTRPTTWAVTAAADGEHYTGTATTTFTFADFGLAKPRVAAVLSVNDEITLEYDFHFVRR